MCDFPSNLQFHFLFPSFWGTGTGLVGFICWFFYRLKERRFTPLGFLF